MIKNIFKNKILSTILVLIMFLSCSIPSYAYSYYEKGIAEFKKGNYEKANELFEIELGRNPKNIKCQYFYAQTYIGMNNPAQAQKEYEKVIELSPKSGLAKLSVVAISKIHSYYFAKGLKSEEKTASAAASDKYGDNYILNALYNGKVLRWNTAKMPLYIYIQNSADKKYYKAAKKAIDEWASTKVISYKQINNPENADILIEFTDKISVKTDKAYTIGVAIPLIKGIILESCSIKLMTVNSNKVPLSENQVYGTALHELGHALGIWGHSNKSIDIMYDIETDNNHLSLQKLSQRDINTLKMLYILDPEISNFAEDEFPKINSEINRAILGNRNKRYDAKFDEAVEYVKKYPNVAISWTNLGTLYSDMELYPDSITCFKKAIAIDPAFSEAISGLAIAYDKSGDTANAYKKFNDLVELEPENAAYVYNAALFMLKNNKKSEAVKLISGLIKANPDAAKDKNIKELLKSLY